MQRLKINLELHLPGDGRTFLNYWNAKDGDDVVCEVIDGKLIRNGVEITLTEFIQATVESITQA